MSALGSIWLTWSRFLEACLLASAGVFMLMLATSPDYWRFINPKYGWLTITAGGVMLILSLAGLGDRHRRRKASELAGLALLLGLAAAALALPSPFGQQAVSPTPPASGEFSFQGMTEEDVPSTFSDPYASLPRETPRQDIDGIEYVRINVAELIVREGEGWAKAGENYAIQGVAARTPELDAAGCLAVTRLFIACCFADAAGVAYPVKVDDPTTYETGQWLRVAGTLVPGDLPKKIEIPIPGAFATVVGDKFLLEAKNIEISNQPEIPFLFELREKEPFAY